MDTSGFTIVTAAMLAEQEAQRQAEVDAAAELAEAAKAEKKAKLAEKAAEVKSTKESKE